MPQSKSVEPNKTIAIFGSTGAIGEALCLEATARRWIVLAGSRSGKIPDGKRITPFVFDLRDESSIAAAAAGMTDNPPEMVVVATGILTLADGSGPERTYKRLNAGTMTENFALNTIGPAIIAKHMLPILPRDRRAVFAALSARVGSIDGNRLGGWHSYRASKTALNMLLKNFAIEMSRTHKEAIIVGIHPGTVDSGLSKPFQSNLTDGQLTKADEAARNLFDVLEGLMPQDSGGIFDWKADAIAP